MGNMFHLGWFLNFVADDVNAPRITPELRR
jgi:hypothetical protein